MRSEDEAAGRDELSVSWTNLSFVVEKAVEFWGTTYLPMKHRSALRRLCCSWRAICAGVGGHFNALAVKKGARRLQRGGIAAATTLQESRSYIRGNEWFEDV